ncbi:MAG: 50S ribosomal protein L11 methyltransferase [Verrucomicrobiales bacterium]
MFVWSKTISASQEEYFEDRFLGMAQTNAVITKLSDAKKLRIEVYLEKKNSAKDLINEFGGKVEKIKKRNWARINAPSKRPLIKIRDQILVSDNPKLGSLKSLKKKYPNKKIIAIPAALAFGTGDHATTSTCLRIIVDISKKYLKEKTDWSFCDIGTGTGILAITAKLMGANRVEGFDFDPEAITIAKRNIDINSVDDIQIYEKDVFQWLPSERKSWNIIAANIFANVLNPNLEKIWSAVSNDGHLVISGILNEHHKSVIETSKSNGMPTPNIHTKGKWVSFHYQKSQ